MQISQSEIREELEDWEVVEVVAEREYTAAYRNYVNLPTSKLYYLDWRAAEFKVELTRKRINFLRSQLLP